MTRKSVVAVVMSALMILSTSLPVYADTVVTEQSESETELFGTPDSEPPKLNNVSADKTEVTAGDTFELELDITDDISGLEMVEVCFINETTNQTLNVPYIWIEDSDTNPYSVSVQIPDTEASGTLRLDYVHLYDNANNEIIYRSNQSVVASKPYLPNELSIQVSNQNNEDLLPPELLDIDITSDNIQAGDPFTLTLDVADDVSGVNFISLYFVNRENERTISIDHVVNPSITNGQVQIEWTTDLYEESGTFELDQVWLYDNNWHDIIYKSRNSNIPSEPYLPKEISFNVTNSNTSDALAPILHDLKLTPDSVEAPGQATLTLTVSDNTSGVFYADAYFVNQQNGKSIFAESYIDPINTGTIQLTVPVSEFEPSGLFNLSGVTLRDKAGNSINYNSTIGSPINPLPKEASLLVKNTEENPDEIITSTTSKTLIDDIKNMPDSGTAHIYHGNNDILPGGVFEAIKGTDKTIIVESNGIQWEFHGQDITGEIKDIDLATTIDMKWNVDSEADDVMAREQDAIILKFADNGQLPGKATIRVKMDYVFRDYLGSDKGLYVYYFDNTTQQFVEVAANISVGNDDYLEFTIDHNSEFVITAGEIKVNETNPPVNPDDDNDNEEIQPPVIDDDTTKPSKPSGSTSSNRPSASTNADRNTSTSSSSRRNATATNNWNQLKADIEDAIESAQPTTFKVKLGSDEMLPASVLKAMQGYDITLKIALANGEDVVLNGLQLANIKTGFYTGAALKELGNYVVTELAETTDVVESDEPSVAGPESSEAQVAKPNPETGAADTPFARLMLAAGCVAVAVTLFKKR